MIDGTPDGIDPVTEARLIAARRKYEVARRAAVVLLGATLVALATGMLLILLEVRETSTTIADCLTPGGQCYERSLRAAEQREATAANVVEVCRRLKIECRKPPIGEKP